MKMDVTKLSYGEIMRVLSKIPYSVQKVNTLGGRVLLELERVPAQIARPSIAAIEFC